jgi:hypothetical protein
MKAAELILGHTWLDIDRVVSNNLMVSLRYQLLEVDEQLSICQ